MEYINGTSLQHRIDEHGPLDLREILRIGSQVAAGLAAAHAQGLIHRDVKPGNIMLENDLPRVKLTDFGLARAVDDSRLTQYGTLAGTPQYMAPEQARGEGLDRRADLFSLGSVLYAMCTGYPAFNGEATVAVIHRVCEGTPPPIRRRNPEISGCLVEIIERLHAKDPSGRFQNAAEVADLLERHLAWLQDPSLPPVVHDWAAEPAPAARPAILRRVARSRWTGSAFLVLLGAAISFELMRFLPSPAGPGQDPGRDDPGTPPPAVTAQQGKDASTKKADSGKGGGGLAAAGQQGKDASTKKADSGKSGGGLATVGREGKDASTKKADSGKGGGGAPSRATVARDGVVAPAGGTSPQKRDATPPAILPTRVPILQIDESRLVQAYRQSFLDKQYDFRRLQISAPSGATNLVRPDPRGVRITIPPKFGESVAVETKFAIHGDFDLRATYEVLPGPTPLTGFGVGPEVLVKPPGDWDKLASLSRFAKPKDTVYSAFFKKKVDGQSKVDGNWPATTTKKGIFRLVRTGATLHYLVAEGDSREFRQIHQVEFGTEDLETARLAAVTGGSAVAVDVLWKDLEIRAEALPGLPGTATASGRSPWWLLLVVVAVAVLAGMAVWFLAAAQRRKAGGAVPEDPDATGLVPADEWDDDGLWKLEEHAAAYATGHPEAEAYAERPRFAFSLRGGVLHGPFVAWAPLDKAAKKRLGANWEEVCETLPKRFEGGYRNGKRNGAFVYRNGSGKPLVRRYRDGELVE
jgi:hypothetical protein